LQFLVLQILLGVYLASTRLPDFLFPALIAGALSSAFIPVFSDYIVKGKESEGHKVASTLLNFKSDGFCGFFIIAFYFCQTIFFHYGAGIFCSAI
jgi:peptidoglycan biosynthesis protein MviN/MurJ (putative lipid II flippase)